jgi:regulator of sigma E protease
VVGAVVPQSIAAEAGFQRGDEILRIADQSTPTWDSAVFAFMNEALGGGDLTVQVRDASGAEQYRWIDGARLAEMPGDPNIFDRLGLTPDRPHLPPVIGELTPGEPAEKAGFRLGDRIIAADGKPVGEWRDWVAMVREHPEQTLHVDVERAGRPVALTITPRALMVDGTEIGRIGAGVEVRDDLMGRYRVEVRYGPVAAFSHACAKTLDMSQLMLRVMGRMLVGQASVENLSGPISIAETAGRTASYGLDYFVKFLAVVSISLGVLNLMPVPILDGGHLLYLFIEWVKGSPLSEEAQMQGQKVGIVLLAALMTLAFYVDLSRLFG